MTPRRIISLFTLSALLLAFSLNASYSIAAPLQAVEDFSILLGRPTDDSITVNVIPDQGGEISFEYGTGSGVYGNQTSAVSCTADEPVEVVIDGLQSNTRYYYRLRFRATSGDPWATGPEHSFHTQRAEGNTFTFTVTSDSHVNIMLGSAAVWQQTLSNVANDNPDFHLDLGDTFAMDNVTTVAGAEGTYLSQRSYMGSVSHSAPIFLALGNHEQEEAWHLDDTGDPMTSQPVLSANARKKYYLNPAPDDFYTGNTDTYDALDGADKRLEDYYAWQWGDALFIVLDPFWYTTIKPYIGNTGGGESSDTGSGDRWDWTLGEDQFDWFKQTIEGSSAKYKFIFAHHMVGGSDDYVRGGAVPAHLVEWGGYNENGSTWGFDTERPIAQWGSTPIHQLMVDNDVSAFFHGHDHQYAYEMRDGIVYQSLPAAGFSGNGFNIYSESNQYTIRVLPSPGHLRVTVSPSQATVDYVGTSSGAVNYSYTILAAASETHDLTMAVDPAGSGTTDPGVGVYTYEEDTVVAITALQAAGYVFDRWEGDVADPDSASTTVTMDEEQTVTAHFVLAPSLLGGVNGDGTVNSTDALIVLSCDVGMDTSGFCPMNCGDVNGDGTVNSTDALIVLSYDAGMTVPFPVGQSGCPSSVTPCSGCTP